jgi:hypothetical protein
MQTIELETEGNLMRKFLWMVAVGGLVLALAAPAMALDFKFGAEYRVRFYSYDNLSSSTTAFDHNQITRNPRGAQIRVRPMFTVTDDNGNIQAVWRGEIGDIEFGDGGGANSGTNGVTISGGSSRVGNGSGGAQGADGVNLETKWLFIDSAAPFNFPLRVRAGIQGWYLPKGLIVDDDAAGVRAYGKADKLSYEVAWFRPSSGPATNVPACPSTTTTGQACVTITTNNQDNNYDYWQFRVDSAHSPLFNPGLYFLYALNKAQTTLNEAAQTYFFGFTSTGKAGTVSYDLDFIYGSAEGGPAGNLTKDGGSKFMKTKGWVLDGGVHVPVGPALLNVVASYATGDKQDGGDSEAFPYIAPSWNGAGGQWEIFGSGGAFDVKDTQDMPTGVYMLGFNVEYRPVKALWLRGGYAYIGFTDSRANCAAENDAAATCFGPSWTKLVKQDDSTKSTTTLGHEVSFRADYDVWTGFKLQGAAGVLIGKQGVPVPELILQMLYNF